MPNGGIPAAMSFFLRMCRGILWEFPGQTGFGSQGFAAWVGEHGGPWPAKDLNCYKVAASSWFTSAPRSLIFSAWGHGGKKRLPFLIYWTFKIHGTAAVNPLRQRATGPRPISEINWRQFSSVWLSRTLMGWSACHPTILPCWKKDIPGHRPFKINALP